MGTYRPVNKDKKNRRGISIKRTAYHEAGHAVVAYILRVRLKEATIIPNEDYLGMVKHGRGQNIQPEWEINRKTRDELERRTMVLLGGNVAENLLTDKRSMAGSYDDYHQVVDLLSYLADPEETSKYIEWLWYRTKSNLGVDYWWLATQRLAEELLEHQYLRGKRIREVIRLAIDEDFKRKLQSRK